MTIAICASLSAHQQIIKNQKELIQLGVKVIIPWGTKQILTGDWQFDNLQAHKDQHKTVALTNHFKNIKKSNAILVINQTKTKINHYIGGNTLIEMGYAYYLKKPIYLLNPIPRLIYTEEIKAMKPMVLNGDLTKIK